VKKGGTAEKAGDGTEEEDEKGATSRSERREAGRGRTRLPREARGRREVREKAEADASWCRPGRSVAATAAAPPRAVAAKGGRAQRGSRKAPQENLTDEKENTNTDEAGEELSGTALLTMLKANPPRVTRYTKGELLSIARLPASQMKPAELSPLIDKENKDSQLLIRMTGGRAGSGDGEDGIVDAATARRERRERRSERRAERGTVDDEEVPPEEPRQRRTLDSAPDSPTGIVSSGSAVAAPAPPPATASASSPSSPNRSRAPVTGVAPDKPGSLGITKTSSGEEDVDFPKASRAYQKWFDPTKMRDQPAAGTPTASAATPSAAATGQAGTSSASSGQYPPSFLQQQSNGPTQAALGQAAYAMQAAAYMQAMSINAAAAAASRGAYGNSLSAWGYNPYLFPPYAYAGAYPANLDFNVASQAAIASNATAAASPGVGASGAGLSSRYANSGAAGRGAGRGPGVGKAAPKVPAMPVSPQLRASLTGGPATGAAALSAKKASLEPSVAQAGVEVLAKADMVSQVARAPKEEADAKNDEEDEAGCSQS